ncbi:MAG: 50S ribosomal protein L15 [bacterium]
MSFVALPAFKNSSKTRKRRRGHVHGRYCGKGLKGEKARSGRTHVAILEGGQMPLVRRLPKRGFSNRKFTKKYEEVNLGKLAGKFSENEEVSERTLKEKKIIRGNLPVKLLGRGEIDIPLAVKLGRVSSGALKKIEKAGGKVMAEKPDAPVSGGKKSG